jgi:hypothetical protein
MRRSTFGLSTTRKTTHVADAHGHLERRTVDELNWGANLRDMIVPEFQAVFLNQILPEFYHTM